MDTSESIQEKWNTGYPIFKKLFETPCHELRGILSEICVDKIPNKDLFKEGTIKKLSSNDKPESLDVWFYDSISISAFGINYKPEHGTPKTIVEFNKFFTLK